MYCPFGIAVYTFDVTHVTHVGSSMTSAGCKKNLSGSYNRKLRKYQGVTNHNGGLLPPANKVAGR